MYYLVTYTNGTNPEGPRHQALVRLTDAETPPDEYTGRQAAQRRFEEDLKARSHQAQVVDVMTLSPTLMEQLDNVFLLG